MDVQVQSGGWLAKENALDPLCCVRTVSRRVAIDELVNVSMAVGLGSWPAATA